jgi:hypothetical protein
MPGRINKWEQKFIKSVLSYNETMYTYRYNESIEFCPIQNIFQGFFVKVMLMGIM